MRMDYFVRHMPHALYDFISPSFFKLRLQSSLRLLLFAYSFTFLPALHSRAGFFILHRLLPAVIIDFLTVSEFLFFLLLREPSVLSVRLFLLVIYHFK